MAKPTDLTIEDGIVYVAVMDGRPEFACAKVSTLKMSMEMTLGSAGSTLVYDIYQLKIGDIFEHVVEKC